MNSRIYAAPAVKGLRVNYTNFFYFTELLSVVTLYSCEPCSAYLVVITLPAHPYRIVLTISPSPPTPCKMNVFRIIPQYLTRH